MKIIVIICLGIGIFCSSLASADPLSTVITKTATDYQVTYVAFSLTGNVLTVDVEYRAADTSLIEKKTIVCDGACYPSVFANTLKAQINNKLKTLGHVN